MNWIGSRLVFSPIWIAIVTGYVLHSHPSYVEEREALPLQSSRHGEFTLNSMIIQDDIAGVKLDGIRKLGESLCLFRHQHPGKPLVIFKSEVKAAYHWMSLHYLWQIKQVIYFEGLYRVDHIAFFGSRGSQIIFMVFMSPITWIIIYVYLIAHLKDYVNDIFSFELADQMLHYPPYQMHYPVKQTCLLNLWDKLGIPHDKEKQESGPTLRSLVMMLIRMWQQLPWILKLITS